MSKVLSQEEIDMLVSAIGERELKSKDQVESIQGIKKEEKSVRPYDFKTPEKLAKEQLRNLGFVYEDFARFVSNSMAAYLRTHVELSHAKTDQITYGDLIYGDVDKTGNKSKPVIITLFSLTPMVGNGILQLDLPLAFCIVDRMLGGPGWVKQKMRDLTPLEREMVIEVFNKILFTFRDAWMKVRELSPKVVALESDPRLVPRAVAFHEIMVRTIFGMKIGESFGLMKLAVPHFILSPLLNKLQETQQQMRSSDVAVVEHEGYMKRLGSIRVQLTAELGVTDISAGELIGLQTGDVVALNQETTDPIKIKTGNCLKFLGRLGTVKNQKAVQITELVREVQE